MRSLPRRDDGSVAIIASAMFALLGCCAAVATDLGMVYLERREAQGAVDLAALSAVIQLGDAEKVVNTVLADNGVPNYSELQIITGRYLPNAALPPAARFVAGALPANAVRVALTKEAPLFFGKTLLARDSVKVGVEAIATATDMAQFSVGSRLLSIEGGVANALLSSMLGTEVSLTAVDYRALASADFDLLNTFDALATSGSIDAVTYQDVLDGSVSYSDFVDAIVTAASGSSDSEVMDALESLANSVSGTSLDISLSDIIDVGPYGAYAPGAGPDGVADAPMLPTLVAAASLANGENQVAADIGASLPGLLSARLSLAIGERAQKSGWIAIGPKGTTIHTAQVRIGLQLSAGGEGLLSHVRLNLPIIVEVAQADAELASITCSGVTPKEVAVDARPGIANAWIGSISPFDLTRLDTLTVTPADIIDAPLLNVTGRAHAELADIDPQRLVFSASDIDGHVTKTVGTSDITESLVTSLVGDLALEVRAFGFTLNTAAPNAVRDQLGSLASPVDDILSSVFELLGIGLGEADVTVYGARCGGPGLVG